MEQRKIQECCQFVTDGDHLPPPKSKEGIPFITITNINEFNKILFDNVMYVPESYFSELSHTKKAQKGDILYSVVGSFGKPVFITDNKKFVFQRHIALLRPNDTINGKYLYYSMLNPSFFKVVDKYAIGCSQRTVTLDTLRNLKINIPSRTIQDNIAGILSLLDEKIDKNNVINDNLQQVIKSCFDFMFATQKPNGIISDILQEHPKSTIQVNDSTGILGDYPFFTSGEAINEWQSALVDGMNCYLSTGGNATIKGYYGKAAYSTDTWCVCGKGEYSFYLFCYLKSIIRSINDSFFAGSGLKHLQKDSLLLVNLYIPSEKELEKFNSIVKPAMETMTKLFLETKKLKQQRDFLLPLLMNGQATIAE